MIHDIDSVRKDDKVCLKQSKDKVFPAQVSCLHARLTRALAAVMWAPHPTRHSIPT